MASLSDGAQPDSARKISPFEVERAVGPSGIALVRLDFLLGPVENFTLTSISGGGGGALPFAMGGIQPIRISGHSTNYHRTFVPMPDSTQTALTLDASETPMAQGQRMSLVYAVRGRSRPVMAMGRNWDTATMLSLGGPGLSFKKHSRRPSDLFSTVNHVAVAIVHLLIWGALGLLAALAVEGFAEAGALTGDAYDLTAGVLTLVGFFGAIIVLVARLILIDWRVRSRARRMLR